MGMARGMAELNLPPAWPCAVRLALRRPADVTFGAFSACRRNASAACTLMRTVPPRFMMRGPLPSHISLSSRCFGGDLRGGRPRGEHVHEQPRSLGSRGALLKQRTGKCQKKSSREQGMGVGGLVR